MKIDRNMEVNSVIMKWFFIFIWNLVGCIRSQISYQETEEVFYQIAGIFDRHTINQRLAFNESMGAAQLGEAELQTGTQEGQVIKDWRLKPMILLPDKSDSYSVYNYICSDSKMHPIAVVGPQNNIADYIIRDQCAIANIPHIQATWQPLDPDLEPTIEDQSEENETITYKKMTINFFPPEEQILQVYAKVIKHYKWENFAALYEDDAGLLRIQKILSEITNDYPVTFRKLNPDTDNYEVFKDLRNFKEFRVILDCDVDRTITYLNQAHAVTMVNYYQHYVLTNIDASTIANELLKFEANMTWLSLPKFEDLNDTKHSLVPRVGWWVNENGTALDKTRPSVTEMKTEALVMNDIANHVIKALQKFGSIDDFKEPDYSLCNSNDEPWPFGAMMQNEILNTKSSGVTGNIEFNRKGERVNYTLYVNEISVKQRETIAKWDSDKDGDIVEDRPVIEIDNKKNIKHFIIVSRKAEPYFYDKKKCPVDATNCTEETADEKYEGFSVDLVMKIFDILRKHKYNYTYELRALDKENDRYGKYDPVLKKWDGLIGELLEKNADLAVCDLTITEERKKVVDFSNPFMSLGISILYTKEKKIEPGTFSFLNPYTFDMWMYTATAYCVVSIVLFVCSRISPADWENPQPCDKDPEELENIWNFKNCAWLTMGSIMTQGCDILPKAIGSRWVCGMWWFFAMIVCQTYIAQLSASMTSAAVNEPINNVEELAKQTRVLYGAISSGSTIDFFKNSKDKMYRRMYENMMANPVVLVNSNDEGEKRVENGKSKYAFFMESSTIEYKLKRNCKLKKVGEELDSKYYGIAMPANSPFRKQINGAILELKEDNELDGIKKKWWEEKNGAKTCEGEVDKNDTENDLEMKNLLGAFLVLIVGLLFCLLITAAEFFNEVRNIVVQEQVSHKEVFIKELKSSLNFFQLQKPVLRNPSRAPSLESSTSLKTNKQSNLTDNFIEFEKGQ